MSGLFYRLGKLAGPKIRKAKWAYLAATAPQNEIIAAEVEVGSDLAGQMLKQIRVIDEPDSAEQLSRIGQSLAGRVKNNQRPFSFRCYANDSPQAFCLPGGFIFVSHAMLELCKRDPHQIAFVLAHEMAHVIEGHVMERMLGSALIRVVSRAGPFRAAAAGAVGRLGVQFLQRAYSQENELRADALAARLTAAAGYDPAAGIDLFLGLAPLEKTTSLGPYFSTHPACHKRISLLRRLVHKSAP